MSPLVYLAALATDPIVPRARIRRCRVARLVPKNAEGARPCAASVSTSTSASPKSRSSKGTEPPVQRRIGTTTRELRAFTRTLHPDDQVVLEATMNTWAIADVLRESGARVVISNPLRTKAIAEAKVKTDQVDALTLAQLLAADFVPEVWAPDEETRLAA